MATLSPYGPLQDVNVVISNALPQIHAMFIRGNSTLVAVRSPARNHQYSPRTALCTEAAAPSRQCKSSRVCSPG